MDTLLNTGILTLSHFQEGERKLNLEGFKNIEKGYISEIEAKALITGDKYKVFTSKQLSDIAKGMSTDLEKGESNNPVLDFKSVHKVVVRREDGTFSNIFVKKIEKAENSDDLEKGITDYNTKIQIEKTGKEIKDKLAAISTKVDSDIAECKAKMSVLKEKIGEEPTEDVPDYYYHGKKEEYGTMLKYPYEKEYYKTMNGEAMGHMAMGGVDMGGGGAKSEDFAKDVRKYNDHCYKLSGLYEVKCEVDFFKNNLEDNKKYQLSTNEGVKLGF